MFPTKELPVYKSKELCHIIIKSCFLFIQLIIRLEAETSTDTYLILIRLINYYYHP